jgi:hypothetical protein
VYHLLLQVVGIKLASVIVTNILHKHVLVFIITTTSAVLANTHDSISQNLLLKATSNVVDISFLYLACSCGAISFLT